MYIGPASLQTIVQLAVPAAFVVSLLLLWLYLRAVKRSMMADATIPASGPSPARDQTAVFPASPPTTPLEIQIAAPPPPAALRRARRGAWLAGCTQIVAGFAYALTLSIFWWSMTGAPYKWDAIFTIALIFSWPTVIVLGLTVTTSWRGLLDVALAYAAVVSIAVAIMTIRTELTANVATIVWWRANGFSTLLVLAFLVRPIRAMGPIVSAIMIAAVAGIFFINHQVDSPQTIESIAEIATSVGFHGKFGGILVAALVWGLPALGAAFACYLALRWLGRLYRRQKLSDQSLQIDAIWLVFSLSQGITDHPAAGLSAFCAYKLVAWLGNRLLRPPRYADATAPRLLLLRVFSLGSRSGKLFDRFARLWRYVGRINMIAGPDLANATVEPHEFLDFMAGRLQRRFISSAQVRDKRLTELQSGRDPDARFRVSSFYCHADTWQMVLRRLARLSDLVLMDLRGFTRTNRGCVYELNELLESVPLRHILLVVDNTTDREFLTEVVSEGWTRISSTSPNRADPAPRLKLYPLDTGLPGVDGLVATLMGAHTFTSR